MKRRAILLSLFSMLGLFLAIAVSLQPQVAAGQNLTQQETPTPVPVAGDYGDAPDSSNNQGVNPNLAYPSVPGNFPTSYQNTAAGDAAGPVHLNPNLVFLGDGVSGEFGADFGLDQDGPNNIVDGGLDNANNDGFDDGWLNQDVPFPHCDRTTLDVRVSRSAAVVNPTDMYLNVWFDGNRNGEWGDQAPCPQAEIFPVANEWIVQNSVINVAAIPAGGSLDFVINTARVPNGDETASHWIRFTLTEDPLPNIARDGRGTFPPAGHDFGETEDYLYTPLPTGGDPGTIIITKTFGTTDPVEPGDTVDVILAVKNEGGTLVRTGRIQDLLPSGISYQGPITVQSLGVVSNLTANYNGTLNGVSWGGALHPDSSVLISFPVEVDYCFGLENETITNTASFTGPVGNEWKDEAVLSVDCVDADSSDITIQRTIADYRYAGGDFDPQANPNVYLPGQDVLIATKITNSSGEVLSLGVEEKFDYARPSMSPTLIYSATKVQQRYIQPNGGMITIFSRIDYSTMQNVGISFKPDDQVISTINVCLLDLVGNDCSNAEHIIEDTPFVFDVKKGDLGDAPDSSNHYDGAEMEAYTGVPAKFPTVHDPALPGLPGPMISDAQPLRLGTWYSYESEADRGPDAVFSSATQGNNIEPLRGISNQDGSTDDGLQQRALHVADCDVTTIDLEMHSSPIALDYFSNQSSSGNAYVNIWVDGNRDGEWNDVHFCGSDLVSEHIVVNDPVDITTISSSLAHAFSVTTGQVPWDNGESASGPARWVRVMLTDRPVTLPSNGGSDSTPYLFGEIEDYLILNTYYPIIGEVGPIDFEIGLQDPLPTEAPVGFRRGAGLTGRDYYRFTADYANIGSSPSSPSMTLSLDGTDMIIERVTVYNRTISELVSDNQSPCSDPTDCTIPLGEIESGEVGIAQIFFSVPAGTTQNDIVIDGEIVDPLDQNPANNKQKVTFKPSYIPKPRVEEVAVSDNGSGQYEVTISGLSLPNSDIQVGIQSSANGYSATVVTDVNGVWSTTLDPVEPGSYQAVARIMADSPGPLSRVISFIVSDLPTVSRLSLIDADGRDAAVTIHDLDSIFDWGLLFNLAPGEYELEAELNNAGDDVEIVLYSQSLDQFVLLDDIDGDGTYTGDFTIAEPTVRSAEVVSHDLIISIKSDDSETIYTAEIGVTSEASSVTDTDSGASLAGATVTAYADSSGSTNGQVFELFTQWTSTSGQSNPAVSDANGQYSFVVESGNYRLQANAAGYQSYRSAAMPDTKGLLSSPLGLTKSVSDSPAALVLLDEQGSTPAVIIEPGDVVEFSNVGNQGQTIGNGMWDSGLLLPGESYKRQFSTAGTYTLTSSDSQNDITVIVEDGEEPSSVTTIFLPMTFR
ncbi:MAG: GEVED domain-containing protein [Anaerolineae bacterium]